MSEWQKSSFSEPQGSSVEVRVDPSDGETIEIQESDESFGGGLARTDRVKFTAWVKGVKAGEFDHLCLSDAEFDRLMVVGSTA